MNKQSLQEIEPLLNEMATWPGILSYGVFGSFATGRQNQASDIDLAFDFGKKIEDRLFLAHLSKISLLTNRQVDLIDLRKTEVPFLSEILKTILWIKKDDLAVSQLYRKNIFDRQDFLPLKQKIQINRLKRLKI